MIIITGLGRCGTSFLTLVFKKAGYGVGNNLTYDEKLRAGMEFPPAYAISRDMYTDYICVGKKVPLGEKVYDHYWRREISFWERILNLDNDTPDDKNEGKIEVIKDPRITWHPEIIRSWWAVRQDLRLIILHRKPEEIIKSRERAGGDAFQDPKRKKDLRQFKEDFSDFMTEVLRLGIPYALLFYPNFMKRDPIYTRADLCIETTDRFTDAWNEILDVNKVSNE